MPRFLVGLPRARVGGASQIYSQRSSSSGEMQIVFKFQTNSGGFFVFLFLGTVTYPVNWKACALAKVCVRAVEVLVSCHLG